MTILTNLFGESPFGALEAHGEKVHQCVRLLDDVFTRVQAGDTSRLRELADEISALETEADNIRNHLHEMLISKVLLPINKPELFEILEQQDSMADRAEDIAFTLTYREMVLPESVMTHVLKFHENVKKNCELAAGIMSRLDLLVESSFKGRDAVTVSKLITELAVREDAVKPEQVQVTRQLMAAEAELGPVKTILWLRVIASMAELSKAADRTGNGIRMTLQIKS